MRQLQLDSKVNHWLDRVSKGAIWAPFVFTFILVSCSNDKDAVFALTKSYDGAPMEQYGVTINYSDSGISRIIVQAGVWEDYSSLKENPRQIFSQGFDVQVLDNSGTVTGNLKAERASRQIENQLWTLMGSVEVHQLNGNALFTESMEWDRVQKVFRSESEVRIVDKGEEIRGKGFEAKEDLSQYTIFAVSGHFQGK